MAFNPKKFRGDHDTNLHGRLLQMPDVINDFVTDERYMAKVRERFSNVTHSKRKIEKYLRKRAKRIVLKQQAERRALRRLLRA